MKKNIVRNIIEIILVILTITFITLFIRQIVITNNLEDDYEEISEKYEDLYRRYKKKNDNTEQTTSEKKATNSKNISDNEVKEKISIEPIGLTGNGDFAFKITNNNNQDVYIDNINVVFKDANGNFMQSKRGQNEHFAMKANSEIISYVWGYKEDFSAYSNYEFQVELSGEYIKGITIINDLEMTFNNTGAQIAVEVKNNNNVDLDSISVLVAYYQNGKIVGCVGGSSILTTTPANGTAYINVEYPEDSHYKKINFDDYKVYLIGASK